MQKKKTSGQRFRKLVGKVHLVLGLVSGTIICFLAITGCLLAFQKEIENSTQPYRFVKEDSTKSTLAPSYLAEQARTALPDKHLHSITYHKGHAAVASFYHNAPAYYYLAFIDPYTGKVLKVKDMSNDFFRIVVTGHYYLWLPPEIGKPIVASATLVFCIMLISGIILWWPRNKAAVKQRFKVKWKATRKRLNYDLHNVFGFYASFLALIIAATGLVWGFQWFANAVYFTASGGSSMKAYQMPVSDTSNYGPTGNLSVAVDRLWASHKLRAEQTGSSLEVHFPDKKTESIELAINAKPSTYWQTDYIFYDQYTLQELPVEHPYGRIREASRADKLLRMNYDIHVGAIAGLPGKVFAFVISLICASLPITGFMVWRGRKKKKTAAK